jgi:YebC/PmpR family DNA-binding regulatory protein
MSGHSKWSTIKHKKAAIDAKRGQIFTKIAREITVAARQAGGDPDMNPRLRLSVDKARAANMPMDNIDRAIKKGTGADQDGANFEEIMYEGYGPGGAAVLLQVLTDNRNRTAPEVRAVFSKSGGSMGEAGSVAWVFTSKAVVTVEEIEDEKADEVALAAIDAGAEDFKVEDGTLEVYGQPSDLEAIRESVTAQGVEAAQATVTMVPNNTVPLDDHSAKQTLKLLDRLEDLDDVQQVFTNGDFSDEVLEEYREE